MNFAATFLVYLHDFFYKDTNKLPPVGTCKLIAQTLRVSPFSTLSEILDQVDNEMNINYSYFI